MSGFCQQTVNLFGKVIKDMKFQTFALGLIVFFIWIPSVQAYPWMFFRESELPEIVEWDIHASYFIKVQATVFSGLKLNYHNPKVDIN